MHRLILIMGLILSIHATADDITVNPADVAAQNEEAEASRCANTADSFHCVRYLRNYDGDTFTVNIPQVHPLIGAQITVRVEGIDSPEMETTNACEHAAAIRAQAETKKFLETAKRIDLKQTKRDKYFRILAEVQADGQSLAQHLLDEHLAVPYDGGHKDKVDWCKR